MRACLAFAAAAFLLPFNLFGAAPAVQYAKHCVSCGIVGADSVASVSGQFVIHGSAIALPPERNLNTNAPTRISATPQMVAVAAERVKRGLLSDLGLSDAYRDRVHIVITPPYLRENSVTIVSRVYADGFHYQLSIPPRIEPRMLIKSIVQVLLLEMANRRDSRPAELPTWLVEGLAQHVVSRIGPLVIINRRMATYTITGYDRLRTARETLQTNTCLTFHELSFPNPWTSQTDERVYQSSAQLFVSELLKLRGGRQLLAAFIARLPDSLNWQTTFYQVYEAHFSSALEVEKWWALSWTDFHLLGPRENWPLSLSLQKLQGILLTTAEFRASRDSLPEKREVSLQTVIQQPAFAVQEEVLAEKMNQLYFLSFNMPPQAQALAAEYQEVIQDYLRQRSGRNVQPGLRRDLEQSRGFLLRSTVRRLDELDQRRASMVEIAASASASN